MIRPLLLLLLLLLPLIPALVLLLLLLPLLQMLYTAATISSTAATTATTAAGATAIATYASFCLAGQEFVTRSLTTKLPLIICLHTWTTGWNTWMCMCTHVHLLSNRSVRFDKASLQFALIDLIPWGQICQSHFFAIPTHRTRNLCFQPALDKNLFGAYLGFVCESTSPSRAVQTMDLWHDWKPPKALAQHWPLWTVFRITSTVFSHLSVAWTGLFLGS